jgi:cytoskeletal protein CcmA (bactofilin family)
MAQNPFFGKREDQPYQPPRPATTPLSSTSSLSSAATAASSAAKDSGSKLTVGPNIKLRGVEITDCDTLVVEGTVEATMNSRVIQIAPAGAFHGTAEIDVAEIHGLFDGTLTVREKLVIYATGKVSGKIRYGKVVIEEGGELTGEISAGTGSAARSSSSASNSAANGSASKETAALAAS